METPPAGQSSLGVPLGGGCLCGAVRFELTAAPVWAHCCHCSRCRRASGTAFAANLFVPREALRFVRGEDRVRSHKLADAEAFTHVFCETCGSALPFPSLRRELVGVPMGSLDGDPGIAPRAHIFVDSGAPWFTITDGLPRHPRHLGSGDVREGTPPAPTGGRR
jgi:hypothetical protein